MLIFIPMAGFGDRYIRAGFTAPKPLIEVDSMPMIEHIVRSFNSADRMVFGVNRVHAETTELVAVLKRLRPDAQVVVVEPHKDGPIQTVLGCAEAIPDDEDVVLNYCDFGADWDFDDFRNWVDVGRWDGAMTAYRGFHPHSLGPTLYAYMRNDGERVTEVREKHHFTADKFAEYASSGLYYFRHGRDLKRIARELVDRGKRVNGEFYVSMAMQRLISEGGRVGVYPLRHFYQWGTPEDLRDYQSWSDGMRRIDGFIEQVHRVHSPATQVIPMAGLGQRFADQGYIEPKPLIDTAGRTMVEQSIHCLPTPAARVLIARTEHARDARFRAGVARLTPVTEIVELEHVTEGQACTAQIGVARSALDKPVLIAPCDTGYVYDVEAWRAHEHTGDADLVVFAARGHLPAIWRPHMYGWLIVDPDGHVRAVSVKRQVADVAPQDQLVITGTFWFREGAMFQEEVAAMIAANDRVNGEFYIDTIVKRMVHSGRSVKAFVVDKYMPWGTPEELKTFSYWNEVFRGGRPIG